MTLPDIVALGKQILNILTLKNNTNFEIISLISKFFSYHGKRDKLYQVSLHNFRATRANLKIQQLMTLTFIKANF